MNAAHESRYLLRVQKTVGRAINRYGMIGDGDRVAVGISGGKDSIVLLETLALRRKRIPINYEIFAVHVNVSNIINKIDRNYYGELCARLGVTLMYRSIEVDLERDPKKTVCFVCSWHRRKELFNCARDLGCNRLALGHHMDDALETLLMNMTFNSSLSSMPPKLAMFGGEFDIIRPLILLNESQIGRYASERHFPVQKSQCPYGNMTRRADMKEIIGLLSKMNRKARYSIFNSLSNIHREYLPPE